MSLNLTNTGALPKERLDFIDGLRGATMLMVVYWHILTMAMKISSPAAMTLQLFRMPLFFFISGFFAYSFFYDKEKLRRRLDNRLHKQLIPTLIIFLAFILFDVVVSADFTGVTEFFGSLRDSLVNNSLSEFKSGYWFTFVLVEVFVIFALINFFLSQRNVSRRSQGLIFLVIALAAAVGGYLYLGFPPQKGSAAESVCGVFSLSHLMRYQCFFYLGAATKAFDKAFWKILSRKWAALLIIAATVAVLWLTPRFRTPIPLFYTAACSGILLCITLFYLCRSFFEKKNLLSESMKFIGKNTLPIYLFHYFVIRALRDFDLTGIARFIHGNTWIEIPLLVSASLLIVALVLGVDSLLKKEKHVYHFIFSA